MAGYTRFVCHLVVCYIRDFIQSMFLFTNGWLHHFCWLYQSWFVINVILSSQCLRNQGELTEFLLVISGFVKAGFH